MTCEDCREEISADLDGESDADGRAAIEAHLAVCPACRAWREGAAVVTRSVRTAPADPGPDLVALVLPAAPPRRTGPRAARVGLAVVGVVQLALGALALTGTTGHSDAAMLGADMAHMGHESAAWNLALGVAFVAGAWWVRHVAGLLPVLGAFILVLGTLSTVDLLAGRVEPVRILAHGLVVVGFVLTLYLGRQPTPAPRPAADRPPSRAPGGRERLPDHPRRRDAA
ncbi:zf-HC2 domain-containing protein [Actinomycetospora corticicola]|uniref:Putative anti-sigma-YlaC factor YlaD n=1 Tax=Actinomycetospora corticicola TaxID=663602 RepID=A0A7Y9DVK9_9PSEU|nr:zf-HC2 domain-containing protein [Actinomycetospora corticicola]NYD36244.1 putative anti-sigma-YlaC factor YlaD [Actinomycetospora corticicola]